MSRTSTFGMAVKRRFGWLVLTIKRTAYGHPEVKEGIRGCAESVFSVYGRPTKSRVVDIMTAAHRLLSIVLPQEYICSRIHTYIEKCLGPDKISKAMLII